MTHDEALDVLIACIVAGGRGDPTSAERLSAAEAHVSGCPDCWRELAATHELVAGSAPAVDERMRELLGCAAVQDQLYLLVGLTSDAIAHEHQDAARHLRSCRECRDALADLIEMEQLQEEKLPVAGPVHTGLAGSSERWVVAVHEGMARFTELPAHLVAMPLPVPAGAWRTDAQQRVSAGEHVTLDLGRSGLKVDIAVEPQELGRVRLSLSLIGMASVPVDVTLSEARERGEPVVAAQSALVGHPFVVGGLRAGRYVLEIHETTDDASYRLELQVTAVP